MSTTVTIVLADDHRLVRQGLRLLLEREPDFVVVGETADGLEVAPLVESLRPDVVVVDLAMPSLGGLDVTREIKRRAPRTGVVMLSMRFSQALVLQAVRQGAGAYVRKESSAEQLAHAIREVKAGRRYFSPPFSEMASQDLDRIYLIGVDAYDTLTPRERQVLHLAAEGLGNPAIGERLAISPRTAETHRTNLMNKLGLQNRAELVAYAVRRGLLGDRPGTLSGGDGG
jgi:DNA-binding NarL/FixJ family response regulator